jgi:hypothetical protein
MMAREQTLAVGDELVINGNIRLTLVAIEDGEAVFALSRGTPRARVAPMNREEEAEDELLGPCPSD